MIKGSIKKPMKAGYGVKMPEMPKKVDCGFYGAKDLQPKLLKRVRSTGGVS